MPTPPILLAEGRKPAANHLAPLLTEQGYNVVTVSTRRDGLSKAQELLPAVIVLDIPSIRFSGRRFCEALRDADLAIPVLMLLDEGAEIDRSDGARGHVRYPISAKKLSNRVVRLLPVPDDEVLEVGDICLNLKQRRVTCCTRQSDLTPKQASLLEVFMRHSGKVLTRGFLMKQVWHTDYVGDTRTLEVHIHWLRKAIEENPRSPVYLRTVRRVGYRFEVPED
jgi:DNA-binding response OmpR family regulator